MCLNVGCDFRVQPLIGLFIVGFKGQTNVAKTFMALGFVCLEGCVAFSDFRVRIDISVLTDITISNVKKSPNNP